MESLTVTTIQSTINDIITKQDSKYLQGLKEKGLVLRQAVTESQWRELLAFPSTDSSASSSSSWKISDLPPYFFGIGLYRENENGNAPSENSNDKTTTTTLVGMVTFYMAYSTWDGRCVFLDKFEYPKTGDSDDDEAMEKGILRPLAKIAVDLGADRLCWHLVKIPSWYGKDAFPPETLQEWLSIQMEESAMIAYSGIDATKQNGNNHEALCELTRETVEQAVQDCLNVVNGDPNSNFRYRLATGDDDDASQIERLVKGLAVFEKEPDAVNITADNYRCDGGGKEPLFYCLLMEDITSSSTETVNGEKPYASGIALCYLGYKVGQGRFLYLEDLYIEEASRKKGGGGLTLKTLARIALSLNCSNFNWVVLDWNTPALNLYLQIGGKVQEGLLINRYTNETLKAFAEA